MFYNAHFKKLCFNYLQAHKQLFMEVTSTGRFKMCFSFTNTHGNVFYKIWFKNFGFLAPNYVNVLDGILFIFQITLHEEFCCAFTVINMAHLTELAAFAVMFLCCIEACSYNSDCLDKNTSDVQKSRSHFPVLHRSLLV